MSKGSFSLVAKRPPRYLSSEIPRAESLGISLNFQPQQPLNHVASDRVGADCEPPADKHKHALGTGAIDGTAASFAYLSVRHRPRCRGAAQI